MIDSSHTSPTANRSPSRRVLVLGATGTIGRATVRALLRRNVEVVCFVRRRACIISASTAGDSEKILEGATLRLGDVTNPASLERDGFCDERFDILISCLASRTGVPRDAWAIDHNAHMNALAIAKRAGVRQMILLSAICVQKPLLAFQQAKLAFEKVLIESGMTYSIVRPTAFFKSLSGQIDRVMKGKPFLLFGDGTSTACKPISDDDLGQFLVDCVDDTSKHNRILPIGGPGEAITPKQQGERLFALLGREPRFRHVPFFFMDSVARALTAIGSFVPPLADKAELARIGCYYAKESMLVLDPETGRYDAAATPSFGTETLFDFYERVINGEACVERGDHSVF
ncbi:MAG: NAD(P)H-binding protein [Proteobacteria bacterium]|nr:NAD(P)H-binding protein [Pseudomonadota bacterium]